MGLEVGSYIGDLITSNPTGGSDYISAGDDHIRLIKSVLQNTFPNGTRGFYFESVASKTANYTTSATDQNKTIKMDASSGARTVSLLSAATAGEGFKLLVEKTDNSSNIVYLDGAGAQTIGGEATWALTEQYDTVHIMSDGNNWVVMGSNISRTDLTPDTVVATTVTAADFVGGDVTCDDVSAATGTISSLQATSLLATSATFSGSVTASSIIIAALDSTPVGSTTPSSGDFTTLTSSVSATFSNTLSVTNGVTAGSITTSGITCSSVTCAGTVSGTLVGAVTGTIGATDPKTGAFTTVDTSGIMTCGGLFKVSDDIRFMSGSTTVAQIDRTVSTGSLVLKADEGNTIASSLIAFQVDGDRYVECQSDWIKLGGNYTGSNAAASASAQNQFWVNRVDGAAYTAEIAGAEVCMRLNRDGSSSGVIQQFRRNGVDVGSIDVDATSTSYVTISDRRLKTNIKDLYGAWEILRSMRPRDFEFISDPGTKHQGFIAQEHVKVIPQAVTIPAEEVNAEGETNYWGVDLSKNVPVLTSALQEAQERIERLEVLVEQLRDYCNG